MEPPLIPACWTGMELVFDRDRNYFLATGQLRILLLMHWLPDGYQDFLRLTVAVMRSIAFCLPFIL